VIYPPGPEVQGIVLCSFLFPTLQWLDSLSLSLCLSSVKRRLGGSVCASQAEPKLSPTRVSQLQDPCSFRSTLLCCSRWVVMQVEESVTTGHKSFANGLPGLKIPSVSTRLGIGVFVLFQMLGLALRSQLWSLAPCCPLESGGGMVVLSLGYLV
jgi:hypothetical protein